MAMSKNHREAHPYIFAAIGVHSFLEYQARTCLTSGVTAMVFSRPDSTQQGQVAYHASPPSRSMEVPTRRSILSIVNRWLSSGSRPITFLPMHTKPGLNSRQNDKRLSPGSQTYTVKKWMINMDMKLESIG